MGEQMNELTVVEQSLAHQVMTKDDIVAQMNIIEETMKAVMKPGVDYGTIPGCGDKPTLYKSGSEKLLSRFRIGSDPIIEDVSTPDEIRYRVRCKLFKMGDGTFLGAGVGEASSSEEKYKWRAAVCDEEFNMFLETMRRIKFKKYQGAVNKIKQVRNNPSDIANTILKMAKKRAQVDGTLTVTAASAIFTQDVEDLVANGVIEPKETKPPIQQPEAEQEATENRIITGNTARGIIKSYIETKTKTGKNVTNFTVQSVDRDQEVVISIWGHNVGNGINPGDEAIFTSVSSRDFKGVIYWSAENLSPVIEA